MINLVEPVQLHDENGTVTLPLQNVLRIAMVHLFQFFLQYQEETKDSTITGFTSWIKEKLDMGKGKQVLL